MRSANLVAEIQFKLSNERALKKALYASIWFSIAKGLSFASLNWVFAARFAELIQFWQYPNFRRPRTF